MFAELEEKDIFEQAKSYAYRYLTGVRDRNVYPTGEALANLCIFEENLPDSGTGAGHVIDLLDRHGSPATTAQTGGRYFGFVMGGVLPVSLAARWLADVWDQNTALQVMSPVASKLEAVVEKWMQQLFGLPERTAAGFVSGSFSATFCGLAAARFRILERQGWDVNEKGLSGAPVVRIVAGDETHSAVLKAIGLLGLGRNAIEWVKTDGQGRIIPEKIPPLDNRTIVVLQAGDVNSGCYDDFETLCAKANEAGAWVHVDGAFGLWAAASGALKYLTRGIEKANSWALDAHKTLNAPYDAGIVLCQDRAALASALHASGAYLPRGDGRDGMFFTPEMSRRARIVEIWAALKYLGRDGLDALVYGLHERAVQFSAELAKNGFEVLNDVLFNQVLVYYKNDDATMDILRRVQDERVCWCGGTVWKGKRAIRLNVCSWVTTEEDISLSVASFVRAKEAVG